MFAGLLSASILSCVYDPDQRCGSNQQETRFDRCVCAPGYVLLAGECAPCPEGEFEQNGRCVCEAGRGRDAASNLCEPCGENETAEGETCVCALGFERDAESGACAPSGLGQLCSDDSTCTDSSNPDCHLVDGVSGYCTLESCSADAECNGGFACDLAASPSYCRRPPLGQGQACSSSADCAGLEATFCDVFSSRVCLVQGCSVGGTDCFVGWSCCDLASLGLDERLCVTAGACPTQ